MAKRERLSGRPMNDWNRKVLSQWGTYHAEYQLYTTWRGDRWRARIIRTFAGEDTWLKSRFFKSEAKALQWARRHMEQLRKEHEGWVEPGENF